MKTAITSFIILLMLLCSCTSNLEEESTNPLKGTWKLLYAEWSRADTIVFVFPDSIPDGKAIKVYTDSLFFVIGAMNNVYAHSGPYTVDGDQCMEKIDMATSESLEGSQVEIAFSVSNDTLSLKGSWFTEKWIRME
jgi:hypothetical protein